MERAAADNHATIFQDHEIPNVLADLGQRAWQKSSVAGVGANQSVNTGSIRQDGFTRAHGCPPGWTRFSAEHPPSPAVLVPAPCRLKRRGWQAPILVSGTHKNRDRISSSLNAVPPTIDLEARNACPDTSAQLFLL